MSKSDATQQVEVERVLHAAVTSAMSDFAALLLAYGKEGPITEDIIAHVQQQVLTTLKNASATGMPLELQAVTFSRAVEEVDLLIASAIRRGWISQP